MSAQEIIDCLEVYGYHYGSFKDALMYIHDRGEISLEKSYHFQYAKSLRCRNRLRTKCGEPVAIDIKNIKRLTAGDQENLKVAVATIGPIAVKIYATTNFVTYSTGVFYDSLCQIKAIRDARFYNM